MTGDCILIKVGAGTNYDDGDIVLAANERRANDAWASRIFDDDGVPALAYRRRPLKGFSRRFREISSKFRNERVGKHKTRQINLKSQKEKAVTGPEYLVKLGRDEPQYVRFPFVYHAFEIKRRHPNPAIAALLHVADKRGRAVFYSSVNKLMINGREESFTIEKINAEYMWVDELVTSALAKDGHAIYGGKGREIWYTGYRRPTHQDYDDLAQAKADLSFDDLVKRTMAEENRSEAQKFPAGNTEPGSDLYSYLVLNTEPFDDLREAQLMLPVYHPDFAANNPDQPNLPYIHKRRFSLPWRKLVPKKYHEDIENKRKSVDLRGVLPAINLPAHLHDKLAA